MEKTTITESKAQMPETIGRLQVMITSFFWTGFISKKGKGGGGTSTSIATTILLCSLYDLHLQWYDIFFMAFVALAVGIILVGGAEAYYVGKYGPQLNHRNELVTHDLNLITIDEVLGVLVTNSLIYIIEAILGIQFELPYFILFQILGCIAFRFYDIKKPGYVKDAEEKLGKGTSFAIMFDDVVAALYAIATILGLLLQALPIYFSVSALKNLLQ